MHCHTDWKQQSRSLIHFTTLNASTDSKRTFIPVRTHHLSESSLITWHGAGTASAKSGILTGERVEFVEVCCCRSCSQIWLRFKRDGGTQEGGG